MSVDFEIPSILRVPEAPDLVRVDPATNLSAVPISLLDKDLLRNFDLFDRAGGSLPLLTREQNVQASLAALRTIAYGALTKSRLPSSLEALPAIMRDLDLVVSGEPRQASEARNRLLNQGATTTKAEREVVNALARDWAFRELSRSLASAFVLLVPFESIGCRLDERQIVKFCYEEALEQHRESASRVGDLGTYFARAFAWSDLSYSFEVPVADGSTSHHFEIAAPEELEISAISYRDFPEQTRGQIDGNRAHMHTPRGERQQADGTEVAGTSEPLLIVHIRPDLGSFLRAAWISAFLASVVLMWGLARLDDIQDPDRSDAVTTLLLLVPSLLSFYLLRPGEHRLVRKALVGSRIAVLMAGCASLMAALSTATGVEGERLRILWTITLGCAILGLAALTAANRWRNPEKPVVRER